jgi:hypothetical protein
MKAELEPQRKLQRDVLTHYIEQHLDRSPRALPFSQQVIDRILPQAIHAGLITASCYLPQHDIHEKVIDPKTARRKPGGYNLFLLYTNNDKENPVSVWAFGFAIGMATCIHDHPLAPSPERPYKCGFTVLQGNPKETTYKVDEEGHAAKLDKKVLSPGGVSTDYFIHEQADKVHRLKVPKAAKKPVVTVHVYPFLPEERGCLNIYEKPPKTAIVDSALVNSELAPHLAV